MSLVSSLMNGGSYGVHIDASKYGCDNGALRIATESVEELHDIFLEFYTYEQAELAAVHEGVSLWDSRYSYVAEAAIGNAITKIKEFFKKLWEKVKAFFKQVKMHLDALFMKAKDFVKKYKKTIQDADKDIKDFSYRMYEYDNARINNVDALENFDIETFGKDALNKCATEVAKIRTGYEKNKALKAEAGQQKYNHDGSKGVGNWAAGNTDDQAIQQWNEDHAAQADAAYASALAAEVDRTKYLTDEDKVAVNFCKSTKIEGKGISVKGREDLSEAFFAYYRNGATSVEDKDDIDVKSLMTYVQYVEESKGSKVDKLASKIDKAYKDIISTLDDEEKEFSKKASSASGQDKKTLTDAATVTRNASKGMSLYQSYHNSLMDAWKTAVTERDGAYKSMLLAGIANAKKNKSK